MNATPTHVFVFIKNKSAYCDAIERTIHRCIRKCKRKEISSICSSCVCNVKKYEKAFRKLTSFFFRALLGGSSHGSLFRNVSFAAATALHYYVSWQPLNTFVACN